MLNIVLKAGTNSITSISAADNRIAPSNILLLNTFVLNIDFLLSLILNTCTNSDNASTINAIVCPTSILLWSSVKPWIGSAVVFRPIIKAARVINPIIIPW